MLAAAPSRPNDMYIFTTSSYMHVRANFFVCILSTSEVWIRARTQVAVEWIIVLRARTRVREYKNNTSNK